MMMVMSFYPHPCFRAAEKEGKKKEKMGMRMEMGSNGTKGRKEGMIEGGKEGGRGSREDPPGSFFLIFFSNCSRYPRSTSTFFLFNTTPLHHNNNNNNNNKMSRSVSHRATPRHSIETVTTMMYIHIYTYNTLEEDRTRVEGWVGWEIG